jgi:hypothetical protein
MLNYRQRIFAEALQGNARDHLAFAVQLGDATSLIRRQLHTGNVLEQHWDASISLDNDLLQVGKALEVAAAAHRELGFGDLDRASSDIHVAVANRLADFR